MIGMIGMIDTTAQGYPEGRKSILNGLSFLERKV
jgi:hypothetical protein